jgi:hypothetical protein
MEDEELQQNRPFLDDPDLENLMPHTRQKSSRDFIQSWVHDVRILPDIQRRDLFMKAHTAMQIKKILSSHSSGDGTDLVILNLPTPDVQSQDHDLSRTERSSLCKFEFSDDFHATLNLRF